MIISALVLRFCCAQVRLLHEFSEGDVPSAMAVPPSPGPGLPYLGILESAALFGLLVDFLRASGLSGHVRECRSSGFTWSRKFCKAQPLGIPGNLTELFQQVYFSILGPAMQARLVTWRD